MLKKKNGQHVFASKVILQYKTDLGETLTRILENDLIRIVFKPTIKLNAILYSRKDTVPSSKCRVTVYEIPCGECEQKYI